MLLRAGGAGACGRKCIIYSYATLGEIIAWIIGLGSDSGVRHRSEHRCQRLVRIRGTPSQQCRSSPAGVVDKRSIQHARRIHKPAGVLIVPLITAVVLMGIYESVRFIKALVVVKIVVVIVVVAVGVFYVNPANWQPFLPNGPLSIVTAASVIFLAYIGFDVVSTTAEETRNPQKDLPAGLIGSLVVCTVLYVSIGGDSDRNGARISDRY
jgi:APA family basic amino acid/polyamine antiporter